MYNSRKHGLYLTLVKILYWWIILQYNPNKMEGLLNTKICRRSIWIRKIIGYLLGSIP
jgi:hypothetical protein